MILPMNTGAEAVETAIKVARKWGYEVKGVPEGEANDHRHGGQLPRPHDHHRQLLRRRGSPATSFGPFTPGFRTVAVRRRRLGRAPPSTTHTVAVLLEPIQGEGGVVIPPDGFLRDVRDHLRPSAAC